jgi:hypothetical protein
MTTTNTADPSIAGPVLTAAQTGLVGRSGRLQVAPEPVELGSVRRFAQAIMDPDPIYHDPDVAGPRFGGVVAPPLYPLHAIRPAPGDPDPLDPALADPDFDGVGELLPSYGLPALHLPLKRLLNGGNEVRVRSLARVGETIIAISSYEQIYEKRGRGGPLVFVVVLTRFRARPAGGGEARALLDGRQTFIWR